MIPVLDREAGLVHGYSTARLGSMAAVDGEGPRTRVRRDFAGRLGLDGERLVVAGAVHGAEVARVDDPVPVVAGVDALVTNRPGLPLLVTCADCFAIVLYHPLRRALGLVHAGWRGSAAGVAAAAVSRLESEYGCRPAELLAGIGPGICGRCYEVGPEVSGRFAAEFVAPSARPGRQLLDLQAVNRRQLEAAGVPHARILSQGACTLETPDLPSHRRLPDGARFACLASIA